MSRGDSSSPSEASRGQNPNFRSSQSDFTTGSLPAGCPVASTGGLSEIQSSSNVRPPTPTTTNPSDGRSSRRLSADEISFEIDRAQALFNFEGDAALPVAYPLEPQWGRVDERAADSLVWATFVGIALLIFSRVEAVRGSFPRFALHFVLGYIVVHQFVRAFVWLGDKVKRTYNSIPSARSPTYELVVLNRFFDQCMMKLNVVPEVPTEYRAPLSNDRRAIAIHYARILKKNFFRDVPRIVTPDDITVLMYEYGLDGRCFGNDRVVEWLTTRGISNLTERDHNLAMRGRMPGPVTYAESLIVHEFPPMGVPRVDTPEEKTELPPVTPLAPQMGFVGDDVSSDILEAIQGFSDVLYTECSPAFLKYREPFIAYTLALASIVRDPSVPTVILEIGKIVNHDAVFVGCDFRELMGRLRSMPLPQNDSHFLTASLETDPLAKAAYDIFSGISLAGMLKQLGVVSPELYWSAYRTLQSYMPADSLDSFVLKVLSFMKLLIGRLLQCIKERSFLPLFNPRMKFTEWVDAANCAMYNPAIKISSSAQYFEDEFKKGAIPPMFSRRITEKERAEVMSKLYAAGEVYQLAGGGGVQVTPVLGAPQTTREIRAKLYMKVQEIGAKLRASEFRPVPLGFYIYGPSNVGKSHLLDSLSGVVAEDVHVEDRRHVRYDMVESKYMDGVDVSKVFFVLDDLDQKGGVPGYADSTWCQLIIKAINNTPFQANMAVAEEKGNVWLTPRTVVFVSNKSPSAEEIRKMGANVGATLRRFHYYMYMHVVDKEQRTAGGGLVEGSEPHDGTWLHSIFTLNPAKDLALANCKKPLLVPVKHFTSRLAFMAWFANTYSVYTKGAIAVAERANSIHSTQVCGDCGVKQLWHVGSGPCWFNRAPNFVPSEDNEPVQGPSLDPERKAGISFAQTVTAPPPVMPPRPRVHKRPDRHMEEPVLVEAQSGDAPDEVRTANLVHALEVSSPSPTLPPLAEVEDPDARYMSFITGVAVATLALWSLMIINLVWHCWFGVAALNVLFAGFLGGLMIDEDAQKYMVIASCFGSRMASAVWLLRIAVRRLPRIGKWKDEVKMPYVFKELSVGVTWLTAVKLAMGVLFGALLMYLRRAKRLLSPEMSFLAPSTSPSEVKIVKQKPSTGFTKIPALQGSFPARGTEGMTTKQFLTLLSNSYAKLTVHFADGQKGAVWAMYLGDFKWLCNKHAVTELPRPVVESRSKPSEKLAVRAVFDFHGVVYDVPLSSRNVATSVFKDVAIIAAPKVVPRSEGMLKFIPQLTYSSFFRLPQAWLFDPSDYENPTALDVGEVSFNTLAYAHLLSAPSGPRAVTYPVQGAKGWCGRVVVAKASATSLTIVGMHAYSATDSTSIGEELLRPELVELMDSMTIVGLEPHINMIPAAYALGNPKEIAVGSDAVLKPMPSVISATAQAWRVTRNFLPLGTAPKFHASKMSSKFVETFPGPAIRAMAKESGYDVDPGVPTFGGEMGYIKRDGEEHFMWKSALSQSLMDTRNLDGPEDALDWAAEDYLKMSGLDEMLCGVVPLSWHEVYKGDKVHGDGVTMTPQQLFNPKDLNTSTGAPYNTQKKHHITFEDSGDVFVRDNYHEEALRLLDMMIEDPDLVIMPLVRASEKDQPIPQEKVDSHRERVFYCSQDAYNSLIKMFLGPVLTRLAKHPEGEMAIGMNIAGPELDLKMHERRKKDPHRVREMAADYSKYDKRQSNQVLRYATAVVSSLLKFTKYTPLEQSIARRLMIGAIYCLIMLKGDIGVFGFTLVSGIWFTAHINSLVNSLIHRAAFWLEHRRLGLVPRTFREEVFLDTLGDDAYGSVAEGSVFNQLALATHAALYGMEVTSCRKGATLTEYTPPCDTTFLKRHFYEDVELGRWKAPLVIESVLGMLIYVKKPNVGTIEDQLAINYWSAKAELYLHGASLYLQWVTKLDEVMPPYVLSHPLVMRGTYEYFDRKFQTGDNLWSFEAELPVMVVTGAVPQMNMVGETPIETDQLTTESGPPPTPPVNSAVSAREVPDVSADDVLGRAVRIANISVVDANLEANQIAVVDVPSALISASSVGYKLRSILGWRGTIKILMEVSTAGSMMGMVIAGIIPRPWGDPTPAVGYAQMFQLKQSKKINFSSGGQYELEVPWIFPQDYASTSGGSTHFPKHVLYLYCMTPLRSALDAGAAVTAYITVYAAFQPDFKLYSIVPNMMKEMRQNKVVSKGLAAGSTIAGALATVPSIAPFAAPAAAGLAAAGALASALGYTRERVQDSVSWMKSAIHQPIGPADGTDSSIPNSLTSQARVTIDPRVGNSSYGEDETSFAYIFSRPGFIGSSVWNTSMLPNVVVAKIPVTPCLVYNDGTNWIPTPTAYVGALCAFWTGSMKIRITTTQPPMASGSYVVFWSPVELTVGSTLAFDPTAVAQACIISLGPTSERTFQVGWSSLHNVARVRMGPIDGVFEDTELNGYVYVVVGTRLNTPVLAASTAPSVTFHYETIGGDDLAFGGARPYLAPDQLTFTEGQMVVASTTLSVPEMGSQDCVLTTSTSVAKNIVELQFAEPILGVRALAQKFALAAVPQVIAPAASTNLTMWFSLPAYSSPVSASGGSWHADYTAALLANGGSTPTTTPPTFNWLGWVRCMYTGVRGGTLVKVISPYMWLDMMRVVSYEGPYSANALQQSASRSAPGGSTWGPTQFAGPNGPMTVGEFYVPYSSSQLFWPANYRASADGVERQLLVVARTTVGGSFEVWTAGASDINFLYFTFTPPIQPPLGGGVMMMAAPSTTTTTTTTAGIQSQEPDVVEYSKSAPEVGTL